MIVRRKSRGLYFAWFALTATLAFADAPYRYEIRFRDVPEWGMRSLLRDSAETYTLRMYPPPTEMLLRRRAERDLPTVTAILRSAGYYSAEPTAQVVTSPPRRVVFHLNPGPRYRLGDVTVDAGSVSLPPLNRFGFKRGTSADAASLLAAEEECLAYVRRQGFPFPRWVARNYDPDMAQHRLNAKLVLDPGPAAVWGMTSITGLVRVSEGFVRNELTLPEGERFNPEELSETRNRLIRLSLFSSVNVTPAAALDEERRLPIAIALRERRPRTIAAGVRYATDDGAGARLEWEHRNAHGHGERLRLTVDVGESAISGEGRLALPQFGAPRQQLVLSVRAMDEERDAYDSRNLRALAQLEREWRQTLWARAGVGFQLSDVSQFDEENNYVFLSYPFELDWNTSGNLLDPRHGHRMFAHVEPFVNLEEENRGFLKTVLTLNRYQKLNRERTWVLAGRVTAGSISGQGEDRVPADERFYAGGGSSVRGYAFQTVGPLKDGDPRGGRGLLETSAELRAQVSRALGLVLFLDGGTAFASPSLDDSESLRWGTGLGLRYFTAVGPLRADIGFPLNRRPDFDKRYQFYLSLGQSF
ncbi:MAG: BamA/TamA family outer membrane protein [Kiritimatiellae bacterium]|nr:BamA/TamA family outer membrane protein [Kiritimatiellia bacterium]